MKSCEECKGKCCKSIAIRIDTPRTKDDFENLKWYIYHEDLFVYVDTEGCWLVEIPVRCMHLTRSGQCRIYDSRPPVCRVYDPAACNNADDQVITFRTAEDVDRFVAKLNRKGRIKLSRKRR